MNARALGPSPRVSYDLPVTKLNQPVTKNRSKTFVVYDRRDGGSDRLHEIQSWAQCRYTLKHNVRAGYYYITAKRRGKKNPMASTTTDAGRKVVVYCNSFYFYFSPHTYVTLKFQTCTESKSKDVFPKLMRWGAFKPPLELIIYI